MAELAASIGTLISIAYKLAKSIYVTIDDTKDAPEYLKSVGRDLKAFYSILGSLYSYLSDEDTAVGVLHPANSDLKDVLSECVRLFQDIQTITSEFITDKATGKLSRWYLVKWPWKEKEVKRLRDHLSVAKVTLNVAISTANLINTTSTRKRLDNEVRELKNLLTEVLIRLERTQNRNDEWNFMLDHYQATRSVEHSADSILAPFAFDRPPTPSFIVSTMISAGTIASNSNITDGDGSSTYVTARSTCETARSHISGRPGVLQGNTSTSLLGTTTSEPDKKSPKRIISNAQPNGIEKVGLTTTTSTCSQVFVIGLNGGTLVINMTAVFTIGELKEVLYSKTGVPPDRISLRLHDRTLDWLDPHQILNNATLQANISARTWLRLENDEPYMEDLDFIRFRLSKLGLDGSTYAAIDDIIIRWWTAGELESLDDLNRHWRRLALKYVVSYRVWQVLHSERHWLTDRASTISHSTYGTAIDPSTTKWHKKHEERTRKRYLLFMKDVMAPGARRSTSSQADHS